MSELPRRIVSRLRRYIGNRRRTKRASVRLNFSLSLTDPRTHSNGSRRRASLEGHTLDLSTNGAGLVVPAIRVEEHYLVGNERKLYVKLELPEGPIDMAVIAVRYESLDENPDETGYLIGARITEIGEPDRTRLNEFVGSLLSKEFGS